MLAADPRTAAQVEQDIEDHMPLGRRMQPEELVRGATGYLASPSSGPNTGHLLIEDGGWTAR